MSTNINITVGGDDLIRRAQAEQAAHRQSQQINRSRDKAGEKGRVERNRRLANQGVDGSRSLVPTAPFTPPRQPEELTAHPDGVDVFGYFSTDTVSNESGQKVLRVRSGDGAVSVDVPYPVAGEFDDLAANPDSPNAFYDNLGRVIGGDNILERDGLFVPIPAPTGSGWASPPDTFYTAGSHTGLWSAAKYQNFDSANYHVLPLQKDAAIVCVHLQDIKFATVIKVNARSFYSAEYVADYSAIVEVTGLEPPQPPEAAVGNLFWQDFLVICINEESLETDKEINFYNNTEESFHAFYVSNTTVKSLGAPPQAWLDKFKAMPGYGVDQSEYISSGSTFKNGNSTTEIIGSVVAQQGAASPGYCGLPETSLIPATYVDTLSVPGGSSGPNLLQWSLSRYKLLGNPSDPRWVATPSIYSALNDYAAFVQAAPGLVTDEFIKEFVPAAAVNLKWRTYDDTKRPYLFKKTRDEDGNPLPESWFKFGDGPTSIRAEFPKSWQKSGRAALGISPNYTKFAFWDWGNPSYCRQQLLSLGFTSEQLSP